MGTGLAIRQRSVAKHNNEHGKPCDGDLIETGKCTPHCHKEPIDCLLCTWSEWDTKDCKDWDDQKYRKRSIVNLPENGGKECIGVLKEVVACSAKPAPPPAIDCAVKEWMAWGPCS